MATQGVQLRDGGNVVAAADLSAKQFYAVKVTAARAVNLAGAGDPPYGILQNKPVATQAADVCVFGVTKAVAGAAVAAGAILGLDSSARVITYSSGSKVGVALEAATVAGQIITVTIGVSNT